jgi:pimeloyl-ACP methyl ester carboxylesterase
MQTELIQIPTDTFPMDGALFRPDAENNISGASAIFFHGNTMNFYSGAARFLPPMLTKLGLTVLTFNRRGHDILTTRASRTAEGGAFQTVAESIADNAFAAKWFTQQGFPSPIIIGHSYGGMLATQHVVNHPQTPALILLSAGRGGTSQDTSGGKEKLFAHHQLDPLKANATELVNAGKGKELMFIPGWWYVISAESFLDRIIHVPDTIALAKRITCPVLAIRGDLEEIARYPAEEFQKACTGSCDVEIIPNCDHFYNNKENEINMVVSKWLESKLDSIKSNI